MVVRTVQYVIVISGTLVIRALLFETSLGFVGSAANFTCLEDLLRYVEDCFDFVGGFANAFCFGESLRFVEDSFCFIGVTANPFCFQERPKSKSRSQETSRDWQCAQKASAQSQKSPTEPSIDELEGPFKLVRHEKSQTVVGISLTAGANNSKPLKQNLMPNQHVLPVWARFVPHGGKWFHVGGEVATPSLSCNIPPLIMRVDSDLMTQRWWCPVETS